MKRMSAVNCHKKDNTLGYVAGIIAIPLYIIALILNILNYIYLRFITKDRKRLPTYVSYYSLNMITLKIGIVLFILDMLKGDYFMGDSGCKYMYVSMELGNYMTSLMVMCICLDQYQFVFHSRTYLQKFTKPWIISLTFFAISFAFCIPFIFLFHTVKDKCGRRYCRVTPSKWYTAVLFAKLFIFFISPCIIMLVLYVRILYYLHTREAALAGKNPKIQKSESLDDFTDTAVTDFSNKSGAVITINFETERSYKKIRHYKRTVVHMAIIFGFFFITALPYFILRGIMEPLKLDPTIIKCSYVLWALGHSFHPLLYTLANKHMKKDIMERIRALFTPEDTF